MWRFPEIGLPPKSSFSLINPPFWGSPMVGKPLSCSTLSPGPGSGKVAEASNAGALGHGVLFRELAPCRSDTETDVFNGEV